MKARKWTVDEKLAIVMEGLKERKSVAEICREHKISQTLYYRWRDKFLEGGKKALGNGGGDESVYKAEIEKLQKIIGKQAIQIEILKKRRSFSGQSKGSKKDEKRRIYHKGCLLCSGDFKKWVLLSKTTREEGKESLGRKGC